jgi:hypothetical protein
VNIKDLSRAIRDARNGCLRNPEFDSLYFLSAYATPIKRAQAFFDELAMFVQAYVGAQPRANRPPRVSELQQWQHDRRQFMLGVLYWNYFCAHPLKTRNIAELSHIPIRRVREAAREGLKLLLNHVCELEQEARQNAAKARAVAFAEQLTVIPLTGEQERIARKIEAHLEARKLFIVSGLPGMAKGGIVAHLYESIKRSWHYILINVQAEQLDQYGRMYTLPDAACTATDVIHQIYEGLGLIGHTTIADQLRAIEGQQNNFVLVINRPDLLPPHELRSLLSYLNHLTHPRIILTAPHDLGISGAEVLKVSELTEAQSRAVVEQARRRASTNDCRPLSEATFSNLYQLTGGVPLALTMLGTYLATHSVKQARIALKNAQPPFDALYEYVFSAAWQQLSEDGRELLRYLVSARTAQLSEQQLAKRDLGERVSGAIDEVSKHNLIKIVPADETRHVRIQPLLHTALRSGMFERQRAS